MSWTFNSSLARIPRSKIKPKPASPPPPQSPAQPSIATRVPQPDWIEFRTRLLNAIARRPETRPIVLDILDELKLGPIA